MYGCESWTIKNAERGKIDVFDLIFFATVLQRRLLESPLDSKDIKSVNPKGNQP